MRGSPANATAELSVAPAVEITAAEEAKENVLMHTFAGHVINRVLNHFEVGNACGIHCDLIHRDRRLRFG